MLNLAFSKLDPNNINVNSLISLRVPGRVAQLVATPTADPGIASSILAQFHTFVEIYPEIISTVILLLPLIQEACCQFQAKVYARSTGKPLSQAFPGKSVVK